MAYRVEYDALDSLYYGVAGQVSAWQEELKSVLETVNVLGGTGEMTGQGGDAAKEYLLAVHGTVVNMLSELISLHNGNLLLYKRDYQSNVDTDLHAVIDSEELASIRDSLIGYLSSAMGLDDQAQGALSRVSDIFFCTTPGVGFVEDAHERAVEFIDQLDEQILGLEAAHTANDFSATEALISSIRSFLDEQLGGARGDITEFSASSLLSSAAFVDMWNSHIQVSGELTAKADAFSLAIEGENDRIEQIQAEIEAREKKAKIINWVVTGVCVIGSVAAIAATGGAATPLVVGAISAASGAVMAGTRNVTAHYVQSGDFFQTLDWGAFTKDVAVAGATGFITGYAGAAVSGAISSGLGSTGWGSTLLNSPNAAVRIGTGAVIGSTSQVGSGVVTRGIETYITTGGDMDAAMERAFDSQEIVKDAAIGGVSGGIHAARDPVGHELSTDNMESELETKPSHSPDPERWIDEKGGKVYVDGNGTWTYQSADGTTVVYSDGYPDFDRAGLVETQADIGSFSSNRTTDFNHANQIVEKPPNCTWHHSQDGHTLQAVPTEYHKLFTHSGGFALVNGG